MNKANGTQSLSKEAGDNPQDDHSGKSVSHAAICRFQFIEHISGVKATAKFQNRRQQYAENQAGAVVVISFTSSISWVTFSFLSR